MNKSRVLKLLAYFFMPVIFSVIGYIFLYIGLKPYWEMARDAVVLLGGEAPIDEVDVSAVREPLYDPNAAVNNPVPLYEDKKKSEPYIRIENIDFPLSGSHYAQLICDEIGLDVPVYWNDSAEILRCGIGQYLGSFLPGFGRMIVLSGHNNSFFLPLKDIKVDDVVKIYTNYCNYQYQIYEVKVLDEKELRKYILDNLLNEEEILVMYTCWPFEFSAGRKTDRLTVFGKRIKGYDVKWRTYEEDY